MTLRSAIDRLFKPRPLAGESEANMADDNKSAAVAGGSATASGGAVDINKVIADAIGPVLESIKGITGQLGELAKNQKVLADTYVQAAGEKGAAAKTPAADGAATPLTLDAVTKLLDEREAKRSEGATKKAAREKFIAEQLKGVPEVYHSLLGDDEKAWAAKADEIRGKVKADVAALGAKLPDVAGDVTAAGTAKHPEAKADFSKLTADQKIALGLKSRPIGGTAAAPTPPATTASKP